MIAQSKRGAGISRTALMSAQNGHLVWPGFAPCGFSHVGTAKLPDLQHTDRASACKSLAYFACLPFLHFVQRLPASDDETLGSITASFVTSFVADDETATGSFDGLGCLAHEFVHVFLFVDECLFGDDEHRRACSVGRCRCLCLELCDASSEHCTDRDACQKCSLFMMFPSLLCLRALSPSEHVRNFFRLGCETVRAVPLLRYGDNSSRPTSGFSVAKFRRQKIRR